MSSVLSSHSACNGHAWNSCLRTRRHKRRSYTERLSLSVSVSEQEYNTYRNKYDRTHVCYKQPDSLFLVRLFNNSNHRSALRNSGVFSLGPKFNTAHAKIYLSAQRCAKVQIQSSFERHTNDSSLSNGMLSYFRFVVEITASLNIWIVPKSFSGKLRKLP